MTAPTMPGEGKVGSLSQPLIPNQPALSFSSMTASVTGLHEGDSGAEEAQAPRTTHAGNLQHLALAWSPRTHKSP